MFGDLARKWRVGGLLCPEIFVYTVVGSSVGVVHSTASHEVLLWAAVVTAAVAAIARKRCIGVVVARHT